MKHVSRIRPIFGKLYHDCEYRNAVHMVARWDVRIFGAYIKSEIYNEKRISNLTKFWKLCTRIVNIEMQCVYYRVAKTHRMADLYKSFSAKEPYN